MVGIECSALVFLSVRIPRQAHGTQGSCRTNQSGPSTLLRGKLRSAGLGHPLRRVPQHRLRTGTRTLRWPNAWRAGKAKDRDYRVISLGESTVSTLRGV